MEFLVKILLDVIEKEKKGKERKNDRKWENISIKVE
jgi:hypothetical protein